MKKKQQKLFEQWLSTCTRLSDLSAYIQNDYRKLLSDKIVTRIELSTGIAKFEDDVDDLLFDISELKEQIIEWHCAALYKLEEEENA